MMKTAISSQMIVYFALALLIQLICSDLALATNLQYQKDKQAFLLQHNIQPNPQLQYIQALGQIQIPADYQQYKINTVTQLYAALAQVRKNNEPSAIIIADGRYLLSKPLIIDKPNIMLLSASGLASKVVLHGHGMRARRRVENLLDIRASGFVLDGITLADVANHLIQIRAESQANFPIIRNCILRDAYQQLLKVSYDLVRKPEYFSDSGLIENCIFEYSRGIGPNYYIGGIDAHGIRNWVIRNNLFKSIASPDKHIAEHAIHLWNNTAVNEVSGNIIINSDRGIGFGMYIGKKQPGFKQVKYSNYAGVIANNYIYHADNDHPFADTGIVLENSAATLIEKNVIFLEHDYNNAIEYRFNQTQDVHIQNNLVNKRIKARNGGDANVIDNKKISKVDFLLKLNERMGQLMLPHF